MEQGSIAVLMLAICLAIITLVLTIAVIADMAITARQTQQSADSVALSAAIELSNNNPLPCATAQEISKLNNVALESCVVSDTAVIVEVSKSMRNQWLNELLGSLQSKAKAGF